MGGAERAALPPRAARRPMPERITHAQEDWDDRGHIPAHDIPSIQSYSQSRTRGHITKSNYGVAPKHRDLTETLEWRRPSRRLRLARWSEPASVPFSRNALYYLSQEKRGSTTCLKSKLEELEGHEASSSKGRMRAQRRAPGNLLGLRGVILRSITNIKNEQI